MKRAFCGVAAVTCLASFPGGARGEGSPQSPGSAYIQLRSGGTIAWGEPVDGLAVGIGRVRAFRGPDRELIIDAYLENRGNQDIKGVIFSSATFGIELDGKHFEEEDSDGVWGAFPPGRRFGPIVIETERFREVHGFGEGRYRGPDVPRLELSTGSHRMRVHCRRLRHWPFDGDEAEGLKKAARAEYDFVPSQEVVFRVPPPTGDDTDAIPQLAALVEHPADSERRLALRALSRFPEAEEAAIAIARGLKDRRDSSVRSMAARKLARMQSDVAVDALVEALNDGSKWVRRDAAGSLGRIGDRRAVGPLKRYLEDPAMLVRLAAVEALLALGEPFTAELVVPIIRSKETNEFQGAARLVRRHAGKQAVPILIRCLDMDDPLPNSYYNYALVWQIGACGGPKLKYHHGLDSEGTAEQIGENRKTLKALKAWLEETGSRR